MHAVIALELGVIRHCVQGGPIVLVVVGVEILRLVKQREVEDISGCGCGRCAELPWAVHIWDAVRPEALRPVVKTAGLGAINQFESLSDLICGYSLLVEVDGYARHQWLPAGLQEEGRVVKWAGRGVNDMAVNATGGYGSSAAGDPTGTARHTRTRRTGGRCGKRVCGAVRISAIDRSRYPQ